MPDVKEIKCPRALLQRKVMWCIEVDNFCAFQRHCTTKGHAILTDGARTCKYREAENASEKKTKNKSKGA